MCTACLVRSTFKEGFDVFNKWRVNQFITTAGQRIIESETAPENFKPLTSKLTDAEIDERARAVVATAYHPAGTAAMGDVVDTDCRVKGVQGLRVVDASILPVSIGAHLQASMYGVAERAAQIIIDGTR